MRWTVGLSIALVVVLCMNGVFIYLAVAGQEPIARSYAAEHR